MTANQDVAAALHELADYAEMLGEDFYKVRAYRRADQRLCKIARWCKIWLPGSAA